MRRLKESGAGEGDYFNKALLDYEAETGVSFQLRHCWEVFKGRPKWMETEVPKFSAKSEEGSDKRYKTYGSSSFNTECVEVSINLNVDVGNDDGDEVKEIRRPIGRDKAKDRIRRNVSLPSLACPLCDHTSKIEDSSIYSSVALWPKDYSKLICRGEELDSSSN
ncbi:zinc finger BED domain-containing protein RICESLEEPER 2-like protein [Tanacetum coccineum]